MNKNNIICKIYKNSAILTGIYTYVKTTKKLTDGVNYNKKDLIPINLITIPISIISGIAFPIVIYNKIKKYL